MRKLILGIGAVLAVAILFIFVGRQTDLKPFGDNKDDNKPATSTPKAFKLGFTGDVMLSRSVGKKMLEKNDYTFPFQKISGDLKNYDFLVGNLESPVSDRGKNQGSIYSFRAEPRTVEGLSFAGFDLMTLANNHSWDWGLDALLDTRTNLEKNGIGAVGTGKDILEAGKSFITTIGSTTIGFLGYTNLYPSGLYATDKRPGVNNTSNAVEQIKKLKTEVNIVIVLVHWGDEYKTSSNPLQQKLGHSFIDAGADLVVGHHPHVKEELEEYPKGSGKYIEYSLGNFVFDQTFSEVTRAGGILEMTLENGKLQNPLVRDVRLNDDFQPEVAKP